MSAERMETGKVQKTMKTSATLWVLGISRTEIRGFANCRIYSKIGRLNVSPSILLGLGNRASDFWQGAAPAQSTAAAVATAPHVVRRLS